MTEGDGRGPFLSDQPLQDGLVRVRPKVLVVALGVGVHDQQLIVVLADAQRERERFEPRAPMLPQLASRPRNPGRFRRIVLFLARVVADIPVGVAAHASGPDLFQTLQDLFGFRSAETHVTGDDDRVGSALGCEVGQTGVQREEITVNVG
jgi:hypothetical protein